MCWPSTISGWVVRAVLAAVRDISGQYIVYIYIGVSERELKALALWRGSNKSQDSSTI
jgi:hypothetical protein